MFRQALTASRTQATRLLSTSSSQAQKAADPSDPVQQMFVQKIREYAQKQKAAGGKMVDMSPEAQKALQDEQSRVQRTFGIKSAQEAAAMPAFKFDNPTFDPFHVFDKPETEVDVPKTKSVSK